jgi:hypothetical protein
MRKYRSSHDNDLLTRVQFAERYATAEEVRTAVHTFGSWVDVRDSFTEGNASQVKSSGHIEWYTPAEVVSPGRYRHRDGDVSGFVDRPPRRHYGGLHERR